MGRKIYECCGLFSGAIFLIAEDENISPFLKQGV